MEGRQFSTTRTQKAYIFLEGGKEKWQGLYRRLSGGRKKSRRNWKDWRGKGRGMNEEEERKMPTRVGAEARVWVLISKLGGME